MKYRTLGHSGLHVSTISLGSWLTYGKAVEDGTARACLEAAFAAGINFIDTADAYNRGVAETVLGEQLKAIGKPRHELVIGTKCFFPMTDDPNDKGLSRKHIRESLDKSLARLQLDYVDLLQCHRADPDTPIAETVRAMTEQIRAGKLLYWGTSCWTAAQIVEACLIADHTGGERPISNQPHYSMLHRSIEAEVIPVCERFGLGQVVWSPLEQGVLTGKYSGNRRPEGSRAANDEINQFMSKWLEDGTLAKVDRLAPIASDLGITQGQLALAWALRVSNVTSAIMGASQPEQVVENAAAADVELPAEVVERIDAVLDNAPRPAFGCR